MSATEYDIRDEIAQRFAAYDLDGVPPTTLLLDQGETWGFLIHLPIYGRVQINKDMGMDKAVSSARIETLGLAHDFITYLRWYADRIEETLRNERSAKT